MCRIVLAVTVAVVGTFAFLGMTAAPAFADGPAAIGDGSQSGEPSYCNGTGFGVGLVNVGCAPVGL